METETQVKEKNPAKVAAGRRSAEIRKAKEAEREQQQVSFEERLAQLEELKKNLSSNISDAVPPGGTSDEVPKISSVTENNSAEKKFDLTPWIIGSVGLAAIVWGLYRQAYIAKPKRRDAAPPSGVLPGTSPTGRESAALQPPLNRRDPFYME